MTTNHPLTLTVKQAAQVLGVGRSTAYELVRTGDLKCIHLRRRIVIPVAYVAKQLGVSEAQVRNVAEQGSHARPLDPPPEPRGSRVRSNCDRCRDDQLALF